MRGGWVIAVLVVAGSVLAGCVPNSPTVPITASGSSAAALTLDEHGCPTERHALRRFSGDAPGQLVPTAGVTAVTLCELRMTTFKPPQADFGRPRRLTTKLSEMVAALNALPDRATMEAKTAQRWPATYGDCEIVDGMANFALTVHQDERKTVVLLDRNCGLLFAEGRTRYPLPSPMETFLGFYRTQLEATPVSTPDMPCADPIDLSRLDARTERNQLLDEIGRNRGDSGRYFPSPLGAITVCHYDGSKLVAHKTVRTNLEPTRQRLSASIGSKATTKCGNPNYEPWQPTRLDILWVADVTGKISEIRIWRAPCVGVHTFYYDIYVAPPALLGQIDKWLK